MSDKTAVFVDYSGVYELYGERYNEMGEWPSEWGARSMIEGKYLPNSDMYARVKKWRNSGAFVTILTGGNDVSSSYWWPDLAQPENVFDAVMYGHKQYRDCYDSIDRRLAYMWPDEKVRKILIDDSMTNLVVASSAGWDAYYYDGPASPTFCRPDPCQFTKVMTQVDIELT